MDRNTLLAFALSMLAVWIWVAWQEQRRALAPEGAVPGRAADSSPGAAVRPSVDEGDSPWPAGGGDFDRSVPREAGEQIGRAESARAEELAELAETGPAQEWVVETPLYRVVLTARGAGVRLWELKTYRSSGKADSPALRVIDRSPKALAVFASSIPKLGAERDGRGLYELKDRDGMQLRFERQVDGVTERKTYRFHRDDYRADLQIEVINRGDVPIDSGLQLAIPATMRDGRDFADAEFAVLHRDEVERDRVGTIGKAGFFQSLFGGRSELPVYRGDIEWLALSSRYFLVAVVPDIQRSAQVRLLDLPSSDEELGLVAYPGRGTISPGLDLSRKFSVYVGPKESERLQTFGSNLERVINLGWFWVDPIARGFTWLLGVSYRLIPNYGVAIILLTLLLRVILTPLTLRQMISMKANAAKMAALQPKIKEIQSRHADDAQRRNEATMAMYREEGVNPLAMFGGCFPMLLQLPVFIALYYALQASIALRQAPFALWIDDLSAPETLFLIPGVGIPVRALPLLMGASMVLQQKLTPTPSVDPAQARMMMIAMPIMFTVLLYGFSSGLVLYWLVSNLLGIAQQAWINRRA